jgi:hypothetical protein
MNKCEKCNKEFKSIYNLNKHKNKKIPCNKIIKCDICLTEFKRNEHLTNHLNRKNKCIKVDLKNKILELEHKNELLAHKNEILELKLENANLKNSIIPSNAPITNNTMNNNITANILINNFGDENINKIPKKELAEEIKKIIHKPPELIWNTKLKIDDFEYIGREIIDIDIFRLFQKIIFNNDNFPENKTIKYNEEEDNFYYYSNDEWCLIEKESKYILIDRITDKIQQLLIDKKPLTNRNELDKLDIYLGEEYDIKINEIDTKDMAILKNRSYKLKDFYNKIIKIEYKNKEAFVDHKKNKIE